MAKGDDIEERLIDFAVRVIILCDNLPGTRAGNHLAGQLLRSGTAPAAHYAEARGAESPKDIVTATDALLLHYGCEGDICHYS